MKIKARSGIVIWITACVLFAAAAAIAMMYSQFDSVGSWLLLLIILAVSAIMTTSFILRNYLVVTESTIKICFGMTTTVLETASVISMKKVTSLMASASSSVKRIEIRYSGGVIYVSPKDEEKFIQAVCSYNQKAEVL